MNINEEQGLDLSSETKGEVTTLEYLLSEDTTEKIEDVKPVEKPKAEDIDLFDEKAVVLDVEKEDESKKVVADDASIIEDSQSNTNKAFIRKMVELGKWQPIETIETEDGSEISFEDAVIDEEMFKAITEDQESAKKEALLKDKISAEGISDFTKHLIEIEKKGGDVVEALKVYNTIKDPLNSLDLSKVSDQEKVVVMLNQAKGLDEETISTLVESYKTKGILEDKAEESKTLLENAYQKRLEDIDKKAAEAIIQRKENLLNYKKDLEANFKDFEINDKYKKKLVDAATKEIKGEDGVIRFEVDNIYNQKRRDPKEAAELIMFLTDKEEYLKQKTSKVVTDERVKTQQKFKFIRSENKDSLNLVNKKRDEKDLIDLNKL